MALRFRWSGEPCAANAQPRKFRPSARAAIETPGVGDHGGKPEAERDAFPSRRALQMSKGRATRPSTPIATAPKAIEPAKARPPLSRASDPAAWKPPRSLRRHNGIPKVVQAPTRSLKARPAAP